MTQALTYVRSRYNIDDETNLARMARQRQYLAALEEKLRQQDGDFVASAYEELADSMVTNIGSGTAVEIAQRLLGIYRAAAAHHRRRKTWWKENTGPTTWTRTVCSRPFWSCFNQEIEQ